MESQKIIAIVNEKGGTCKTTTSVNLAAALGEAGKRVLLVDLDGQAASSRWLGVEEDNRLAEAMCRGKGLEPIADVLPGVSLAPASGKLDSVAHDLRPTQGGQLRKVLGELTGFDFILIDCPPSLGNRLIGNALLAASHVLVPVETSILALDGLKILLTTLDDVREGFDHKIILAGVLACRYDSRTRLSRLVLAELQRALPGKVFATVIRENVRMRECPASGKSILTFADDSHAAADYRALANEIIQSPQIWLEAADTSAAAQTAMGEAVGNLRTNAAAAVRQAAGMDAPAPDELGSDELAAQAVGAVAAPQEQSVNASPSVAPTAPIAPTAATAPVAPVASATPATEIAAQNPLPVPTIDPQPSISRQPPGPHKDLHEELARLSQAQQHLLAEVELPQDEDTRVFASKDQAVADEQAPVPIACATAAAPAASPALQRATDVLAAEQPAAPSAAQAAASPAKERFPAIPSLRTAAIYAAPVKPSDAPHTAAHAPDGGAQLRLVPQHAFSFSPQASPTAKPPAGPSAAAVATTPGPADASPAGPADARTAGDSGAQGEKKPDFPALREYMRQMAEAGRLPGASPAAKQAQAKEPKLTAWRRLFQKGA